MRLHLKEIREAKNLTQADLAKRLGTSSVSIGRYEREPQRVNLPILEALAKALNVKTTDLYSEAGGIHAEPAIYIPAVGGGAKIMAFDAELARQLGNEEDLSVLHVEDDSMEPTLRIGDMCIVDVSKREVDRDGIYVIQAGGRLIPRRVAYNPVQRGMLASADNKLYQDVWNVEESGLEIAGRIVYGCRRF